jgi:hypothetical protein
MRNRVLQRRIFALLLIVFALSWYGNTTSTAHGATLSTVKSLTTSTLSTSPKPPLQHTQIQAANGAVYPNPTCCVPPIVYKGGRVQHHPRVYLIFWGPGWNNDTHGVQAGMSTLFNNLANTSYNNILLQYYDNSGDYVHSDVQLAGTWTDTGSTPPATTGITLGLGQVDFFKGEVGNAITSNNWTYTLDTEFLVFPQAGSLTDLSKCGEHSEISNGKIDFGYVAYFPSGCNYGSYLGDSVAGSMMAVASHEYAETATDPDGSGWHTNELTPFSQNEIGDLCQYTGFSIHNYGLNQDIPVQPLWDQSAQTCALHDLNSTTPYTYVAQNIDRSLEVFARGSDNNIWHNYENSQMGSWQGWSALQSGMSFSSAPTVARNTDGRLEVFARGSNGSIYHIWQIAAKKSWSTWTLLSQAYSFAGTPAVGINDDGRLEVFSRGSDGNIWHNWQLPTGGWAGWVALQNGMSFAGDPVVGIFEDRHASSQSLQLYIVARGTNQSIQYIYQQSPNGGWSTWNTLAQAYSFKGQPAIGRNEDGHMEVFARGIDNLMWHSWLPLNGNSNWAGWSTINGNSIFGGSPAVVLDQRNDLEVFALYNTNAMYEISQSSPNQGWGAWNALDSTRSYSATPAAMRNSDGTLDIITFGADNNIWEIRINSQTSIARLQSGYTFQP